MNPDDLEWLGSLLSPAEAERLLQAVQRTLLPAIRLNTLKTSVEQALDAWPAWYGWQVRQVPFCAAGWQITGGGSLPLARTLEHKMGFFYIQEAASMLPVEMFQFGGLLQPLILDMAASPGGKTTHLACKVEDKGLIIANDTSTGRMAALCSNLQDWGTMCAAVTHYPGERLGCWFPETFDVVLLDAPCSGESLRSAERRKSRPISPKERHRLHQRQVALLTSAFQTLKPGGQVVYATCTMAPQEDEAVLDGLLDLYPRQVAVEVVDHVPGISASGLASDGERAFRPEVTRAVRLWPHLHDTAGFFSARLRKLESVATHPQPSPRRSLEEVGFEAAGSQELAETIDRLRQSYGFDLGSVIEEHALVLWRRGQQFTAIPERLLSCFGDLPCVAAGMLVGEWSEGGFLPSHELLARFSARCAAGRFTLSAGQAEMWMAGRDLRGLDTAGYPAGMIVLAEDEKHRFLGRAKVLNDRVRNMLPRRLVY